MKKEQKTVAPEENVAYTFRIASKKTLPYLVNYLYYGQFNINGLTRYKMYDVTNGYYTYMPPTKFSQLMKTALVSQCPVVPMPKPEEQLEITLPEDDVKGGGLCNS